MFLAHHDHDRPAVVLWLCRTLYIWTTWVQVTQGGNTALIPSAPVHTPASLAITSSAFRYTALIPSKPPQTILIPSQSPTFTLPSVPLSPPSGLKPSAPSGIIPSAPGTVPSFPQAPPTVPSASTSNTNVGPAPMPSIISTEEGLRPIPAPTANPGNPDGHHEISEPNFSATRQCRACSPVIEISVTGFDDYPTTMVPKPEPMTAPDSAPLTVPAATMTAGPSPIIVSQEPSGGNFVIGDSTTVSPGQTVTINHTPIVIQTSSGKTEIIIAGPGTSKVTRALTANPPVGLNPGITAAAIPAPLTIGTQTITADSSSNYIIGTRTLQPGGTPITIDGTTISLLPSATGVVINGKTSSIAQAYSNIYTTTTSASLTLNGHVYTANKAGYYIISPGTTLIPGGPPVTVSGTVVSLEPKGTAAVIGGATSAMAPVTTVVTLTRSVGGQGNGPDHWSSGMSWSAGTPLPPVTGKHNGAGLTRGALVITGQGYLESAFLLGALGLGWLAICL